MYFIFLQQVVLSFLNDSDFPPEKIAGTSTGYLNEFFINIDI